MQKNLIVYGYVNILLYVWCCDSSKASIMKIVKENYIKLLQKYFDHNIYGLHIWYTKVEYINGSSSLLKCDISYGLLMLYYHTIPSTLSQYEYNFDKCITLLCEIHGYMSFK